jgi:hypothetical protein
MRANPALVDAPNQVAWWRGGFGGWGPPVSHRAEPVGAAALRRLGVQRSLDSPGR